MKKVIFNKPFDNVIDHGALNSLDTIVVVKVDKSLNFTVNNVNAIFDTEVLGVIVNSIKIKDKPFEKGYVFIPSNGKELPNILSNENQYEYRDEIFNLLKQIPTIEYYVIPGK